MALGLTLSVQSAMVSVEKVMHAVGGQHVANAVGGPVFYVDHAYDPGHSDAHVHVHDHDHPSADDEHDADEPSRTPSHHHHFVDSPLTMGWAERDSAPVRFTAAAILAPMDTSLPPETVWGGLERPPKRI